MEEDWELVRDNDFVYKLPKRPSSSSSSSAPPLSEKESNHIERKKTILLKLKKKYQQEISHWELLSNTLQALQKNHPQIQPPLTTLLPDQPIVLSTEHSIDSLLILVEAQEASINEMSALCNVAEDFCSDQEKLLNHPFLYLPIWESSPRELIASLCDE